jgi:autotransporter-associated beta strand protein
LAGTPTITVPASGTTTIGCVLAGSAGCTVAGGALTLTNVETYTGGTTISSGTLTIGGSGQLGSGSYAGNITDNGAFIYNSTAAQTLSAIISGSGTLTQNGSGALTISGTGNSYQGITTINGGYLYIARDLSLGAAPSSLVATQLTLNCSSSTAGLRWTANNQTLNANRGIYLAAGNKGSIGSGTASTETIAGPISGPGNFSSGISYNTCLGTNILTGLSSYTGTTTISAGRLLLGVSGALPSTTALTIAADNGGGGAGGVFDLGGYNQTIGSLTSSTGIGGTGGPDMPTLVLSGALTVNETSNSTFNGNIICTGGSLSIGSGTLILGGGIVGATVTAAGSGISAPATFSVTGGGGTGATVSPSLGVTAATFTISQGTQTYTVAPTVTISGGGGSPTATATANLSSGLVTSITITSPGGGYTSAPTIAFSGGTVLVSGTAPTGTGNASNFQLVNVVVTANGSGYTTAPTLTLSSGTGAATAQLASVALAAATSIGGAGNLNINSVISGGASYSLATVGAGTVTLANANTYSGPTTINAGELVGVTGGSCASSAFTVADGATNGVSITDNTKQWNCGSLTYNSGAPARDFNFGYSGTPSPSLAPLNVNGDVTFNGTPTVTIEAGSFPAGSGTYPLMTWSGNLYGTAPATATLPPHVSGYLGVSGNTLNLYITASTQPLRWTGAAGNGLWDVNTSQNWDDSAGNPTYYEQTTLPGDAVILDETYISASPAITLNSTVTPASVTVSNSTYNYAVSGTGGIAGPIGLTKLGSGTLTLGCANTYSGSTTIAGGTLSVGVDNNLGAVPASTTAASIVLSNAALSANASFALSPNRGITMQANSTLDVASGKTLSYAGIIAGPSFSLTKTGAGTLIVSQDHNSYSGNTIISAGILQTGGDHTTGGTPSNLGDTPSSFIANNITLAGGTLQGNNPNFAFSANRGITLTADSGLSSLTNCITGIPGPITGPYGLTITCPVGTVGTNGVVYLEGTNTYTGNTIISSGVLSLTLNGSISNSPSISIAAGAALDVSGLTGTFTLASGQSLIASGTGTTTNIGIANAAVLNGPASGTVSLGSQPITLNFTPAAFTGDATHPSLYVPQGALSLNGNSFTVNNAAGTPLGVGTYVLIQQAGGTISSSGSYSVSVTGTGLAAGTAASISVTGESVNLDVVTSVVPKPVINSVTLSGPNLIFSGTNGSDSGNFYVLASTNVALPLSNWTSIATGSFSPMGAFSVTNAVGVNPSRFFIIQIP